MSAPADPARKPIGGLVPTALAAGLFTWFATFLPEVAAGEVVRLAWDWVPSMGIALSFVFDGLSLTFALLISGIGALVFLYSNTYLAGYKHFGRFMWFLTAFMLAMLGLVLADNLIALFVFWELTTITSYLLIGFGHETTNGRRSALQALFVTGAGALALLAGLILMGLEAGTFEISEILAQGGLQESELYIPILVLVLAGAFTKSAQFPFHFWLPNAMAAPTPVSAFLHSATMVKAGVYLMARLYPGLSGTDAWIWTLTIAGGFTTVFASVLAVKQTDLKQTLAYTTLMALGTLTLILGQSGGYSMTAFVTFLVTHSLYKASLFLMIGCVDYGTGTRDADVLGGLGRRMPITAAAAGLAALSMAGLPPFIGFIAKELAYAGALEVPSSVLFVAGASLAANALMFAVAGIVAFKPFWRPAGGTETPRTPKEAPWPMLFGPLLLALLGLVFGLAPGLLQGTLVNPTVMGFMGEAADPKTLKLWAGVNVPLFLSLATFVLGFLLYVVHRPFRAALNGMAPALPNFDSMWDKFLDGLKGFAAWQTRVIQPGILRVYVFSTFTTVLVAISGTMIVKGAVPAMPDLSDVTWKNWALVALLIVGAVLTCLTRSRITAMAALGVVGIGVAIIFITFSAPDVAITQLLVETLVIVLVAVALLRLPTLRLEGDASWRPLDAALSAALGLTVTLVLLAVLETPLDLRLTEYFEATSWPDAFGRNIVNVILVDFRALDTFGEIAVVVIAALSAYALLRTTSERKDV
ncbi:MAG: putative monovalent cation/H+ antiporter subunit A [Pseudomonadota bacterium]